MLDSYCIYCSQAKAVQTLWEGSGCWCLAISCLKHIGCAQHGGDLTPWLQRKDYGYLSNSTKPSYQVFTGHIRTLCRTGWYLHSAQNMSLCVCVCLLHIVMNSDGSAKSTVVWSRFQLHRCFSTTRICDWQAHKTVLLSVLKEYIYSPNCICFFSLPFSLWSHSKLCVDTLRQHEFVET